MQTSHVNGAVHPASCLKATTVPDLVRVGIYSRKFVADIDTCVIFGLSKILGSFFFGPTLFHVSFSILHDEQDCADAVQVAILKAYENRHKLKEIKYFKTWIVRIVINECYGILRKKKRFQAYDDAVAADNTYLSSYVKEEYTDLYRAIDRLSQKERMCVVIYYLENYSVAKTAYIFAWNPAALDWLGVSEELAEHLNEEGIAKQEYATDSDAGVEIRAVQSVMTDNCCYVLLSVSVPDQIFLDDDVFFEEMYIESDIGSSVCVANSVKESNQERTVQIGHHCTVMRKN